MRYEGSRRRTRSPSYYNDGFRSRLRSRSPAPRYDSPCRRYSSPHGWSPSPPPRRRTRAISPSPQSSPENPHQVVQINDSPVSDGNPSEPAAASDASPNSAVAVAVQQSDTGANLSAKIDDISEKIESLLATQKEVIDNLAKVLEIARECLKCCICHEKLSGPIKVYSDCGQIVDCDTCLAQALQTRRQCPFCRSVTPDDDAYISLRGLDALLVALQ